MDKIRELNNNPVAKLAYLKQLLALPNISAQQQSKIYKLIQETDALLIKTNRTVASEPLRSGRENTTGMRTHDKENTVMPMKKPVVDPAALSTRIGTRDQNPRARELVAVQTFNDMNTLSAHYSSEEARAEAEFELEQRRRAEQFRDAQRQRRMDYQAKLQELNSSKVDSLKLFGLGPNFTLAELKHAYKRMAIETHPDRPGGNTEKFQTVTKCYMSLLEKLKGNEPERGFDDLRKGSRDFMKGQQGKGTGGGVSNLYRSGAEVAARFRGGDDQLKLEGGGEKLDLEAKNFNVGLFNKLYEANKLWDPNDDGYDDWFRKGEVDDIVKAPPVFSNKFNLDVFNTTFGDWKNQVDNMTGAGAIMQYQEPRELINTTAGWSIIDAGKKVEDFTKAPDQAGSLAYTDLKLAYAGNCNMINPATAKPRESYRNVDELVKSRDKISFEMSPQDMAREEARKYAEQQAEQDRIDRLRSHEQLQADHYSRVHQRMLGYSKKADY